jgi:hypothetical protein
MVNYKIRRFLVERKRKLKPSERIATRIGYMGAGFLIAAQWTLEPVLYILGFNFRFLSTKNLLIL